MPNITFLNPADQPTGTHRLINDLKSDLQSNDFNHFKLAVAFAKVGPLLRMEQLIKQWTSSGKTVEALFGIDHMGTSYQALEFALNNFTNTYITNAKSSTFHPKLYLFYGDDKANCYYGSHNLTVGGTETNFEGGIKIEFDLPIDQGIFDQALYTWTSVQQIPATIRLDQAILTQLLNEGRLIDELTAIRRQTGTNNQTTTTRITNTPPLFGQFNTRPPSPLPRINRNPATQPQLQIATPRANINVAVPVQSLIIQIVPHHNGEVFLSKTAVNQNPQFFGYPFTGQTLPKKAGNQSYPQRDPDPVVNFYVYDATEQQVVVNTNHNLNMVYYERKSEIRIQFPTDVLAQSPEYSIMVMTPATNDTYTYDYDISIYQPGSQRYNDLLASCNQTMPSGGAALARRMGWL